MRQNRQKILLYSIPIRDIELRVHGYEQLTPHDVEMLHKAVDVIKEIVIANEQMNAEEHLRQMQIQEIETADMSK